MLNQIQEELKDAMRAKDELKLTVLRNIKASITNELIAQGKKPTDTLTDEEILTVINRLAKQRKDSIEQFEKAGRNDLAEIEKRELALLETYLPKPLTEEELISIIESKKTELGISDMSGIGQLMGAVMKEAGTRADGNTVKTLISTSLQ